MSIHTTAGAATRIHPSLPIFLLRADERVVFYTPGHTIVCSADEAASVERALSAGETDGLSDPSRIARQLEDRGRVAVRTWTDLAHQPFEPECLTLYLSNQCNLGCSYCFAAPVDQNLARTRLRMHQAGKSADAFPVLLEDAACAAARVVAQHCVRKNKPLTLVFHGGGEPTLHWDLLGRLYARVGDIAQRHDLRLWTYLATHGVINEERARWLAGHMDLIGLSCDGPPDIQDANRPSAGGAATSRIVERTADVFASARMPFTVRATITPATVRRQSEILLYAHEQLRASSVRFEPAYNGRHGSRRLFRPLDAEEFVDYFLQAGELARRRGCDLQVSGVRMGEIHGPYCNPTRQVLQLTPDGVATACFLSTGSGDAEDASMALGRFDPATGEFEIDQHRAASMRAAATRVPKRCEECVNIYHCARDCPDSCVVTATVAEEQVEGFRCRVQKLLAWHWIRNSAIHHQDDHSLRTVRRINGSS